MTTRRTLTHNKQLSRRSLPGLSHSKPRTLQLCTWKVSRQFFVSSGQAGDFSANDVWGIDLNCGWLFVVSIRASLFLSQIQIPHFLATMFVLDRKPWQGQFYWRCVPNHWSDRQLLLIKVARNFGITPTNCWNCQSNVRNLGLKKALSSLVCSFWSH